jgi:hypothetical protein
MDMIDEDEELNFIDDDIPTAASKEKISDLKTIEATIKTATGKGENSGLEPRDPIDLDSSKAENPRRTSLDRHHQRWGTTMGLLWTSLGEMLPHLPKTPTFFS